VPLPRALEADPRVAGVLRALSADRRPLWSGGTLAVPHVPWTRALEASLAGAMRRGQLVLGLDAATARLRAERAGLGHLAARGEHVGARVSRVALLARDGAGRFRRQVERLVREHGSRLLVIVTEVDAAGLGASVTGSDRRVQLVLASHRDAVCALLLALA